MKADKHRVIIGWLYEAMAMLLAVFVAYVWKRAMSPESPPGEAQIILYAIVVAALFAVLGLTLLLKFKRSYWACLPFSVMMLIYFPVGTALGGYYIWYFWKFHYRKDPDRE